MSLKNYSMYQVCCPATHRPSGRSAVLVRPDIIHSHIAINTNLQAVAVRLTLHKMPVMCSIYIPPGMSITLQDLDSLVSQLPSPFILLGDFNGHNPIWGGNYSDAKGKILEKFIAKNALCLWNESSHSTLPLICLLANL